MTGFLIVKFIYLSMNNSIKILMIEDNHDDAQLISKFLERNAKFEFTISFISSKTELEDALQKGMQDVVLCDHSLPSFNSEEALKMCREQNPSLPFIIVTGAVKEDAAINIFELGADNYIMKDNLKRLPSAITKALQQKKEKAK